MEERRLFYVACTRARQRLVVTAVAVARRRGRAAVPVPRGARRPRREGRRPPGPAAVDGRPGAPSCAAPSPTPTTSEAAARRRRAAPGPAGRGDRRPAPAGAERRPLDLVGHPRGHPLGPAGARPRPAGAGLGQRAGVDDAVCPTQWFLEREAGGVARAHQSANLGEMVHALAQRVATGELAAGPDDVDLLMAHVDAGLGPARLPHALVARPASTSGSAPPSPGSSRGTTPTARTLVGDRGAVLHRGPSCPTASEVSLTGYADRLELDADGKRGGGRPQDRAPRARATSPSRATSSSASTSTPSTTAPSTTGSPSPPRPGAPSSSSSA